MYLNKPTDKQLLKHVEYRLKVLFEQQNRNTKIFKQPITTAI